MQFIIRDLTAASSAAAAAAEAAAAHLNEQHQPGSNGSPQQPPDQMHSWLQASTAFPQPAWRPLPAGGPVAATADAAKQQLHASMQALHAAVTTAVESAAHFHQEEVRLQEQLQEEAAQQRQVQEAKDSLQAELVAVQGQLAAAGQEVQLVRGQLEMVSL